MEKAFRRVCNHQGAALLIYKMIMNTAVTIAMLVGAIGIITDMLLSGEQDVEAFLNGLTDALVNSAGSGWGYLLAIMIGTLGILLWKKPRFFRREILQQGKPMKFGSFVLILCLFMSAQLISQLGLLIMDFILGFFGKSMSAYLESAGGVSTDQLSMWLYAGLGAPIFEELLFRGLVMRSMEPYGKRISILLSALLFGFYHGNPIQAPFAFLVGLVLGYVAMEYNIIWAMVLHMFNNLIFADAIPRLLQNLPIIAQNWILYSLLAVFAIVAAVILIVKRHGVLGWLKKDAIQPWQYNAAFLSPLVLILVGSCVADMVLFMLMVLIA